eukprot:CAMPEP_0184701290 /NCGR_PEP_ID=MMETSP0313-20130426/19178_1 /TAXON_ID=2792 /ORGANISM="Porphyridium aerugineum, Strain SAG 1380-2" /LENGTH=211 /DNA_ID=CAMNT_0027161297 /DNA_START=357 /DNA_END=988 /DNA_ORIENTATION=-
MDAPQPGDAKESLGADHQNAAAGGNVDEDVDAELNAMRKRLKEMEEEAAKLNDIQNTSGTASIGVGGTVGAAGSASVGVSAGVGGSSGAAVPSQDDVDARSVYVGNVDYGATPEELKQHFQDCGIINRVTILCNKYTGQPKGFAYIEFTDEDAVKNATILNESMFRNRPLKVTPKRTNVPGMNVRGGRGGGSGPRGGGGGYRPNYRGGGGG